MLYPGDFVHAIEIDKYSSRDTPVLARIALNALVDAERFPVDISEIRSLGIDARLAARGFLAYMANNLSEFSTWSQEQCEGLLSLTNTRTVAP